MHISSPPIKLSPEYLLITSSLFFIPVFIFLNNKVFRNGKEKVPYPEYILAGVVLIIIGTFQWFWRNPEKDSLQHTVDKAIVITAVISFIVCTVFFKIGTPHSYYVWLALFFAAACASYYHSSREWVCDYHILYHGVMYIFVCVGAWYAFL